jgi:hypothetical protein
VFLNAPETLYPNRKIALGKNHVELAQAKPYSAKSVFQAYVVGDVISECPYCTPSACLISISTTR